MHFFLDSADIEEIRKAVRWGVIDGVTTNPSLVAKSGGRDFHGLVREIAALVNGPVSAEVTSLDPEGMVAQGDVYKRQGPSCKRQGRAASWNPSGRTGPPGTCSKPAWKPWR